MKHGSSHTYYTSYTFFTSYTSYTHHRLNWQLHFGDPPKWAAGVKFILIDVDPTTRDMSRAHVVLKVCVFVV